MGKTKGVRLNDDAVKRLKPRAKKYEVWDSRLTGFGIRVLPTGSRTYYARWWGGRNWKWYRIGDVEHFTPDDARKQAMQVLADADKGIDHTELKRERRHAEKDALTLGDYAEGSYKSTALYARRDGDEALARLKASFPTLWKRRLHEITLLEVERWRSERLKTGRRKKSDKERDGCSPATLNRDITELRLCLAKAVSAKLLKGNPLDGLKPLKVDSTPKTRVLTEDEEKRLYAALDKREQEMREGRASANVWRKDRGYELLPDLGKLDYADFLKPLITLLLYSGIRRGEAFNLRWSDVDFDKATIRIQGATAKTNRTRFLPMNSKVEETLGRCYRQRPSDDLVFPSPKTGGKMDNIKTSWSALLEDAGIAGLRLHDLRHTFATRLVESGCDLYRVQKLLGHSSISVTERYSHLNVDDLRGVSESIVPKTGKVVPFPGKARGK